MLSNNKKNVTCSFGYKLDCVNNTFSKSYLGEDIVYNFMNCRTEESKYFSDVIKRHSNKELLMTKKDDENC